MKFKTILFHFIFCASINISFCQIKVNNDSVTSIIEDSSNYMITPININSKNADFSPFLTKDQLIFVSDRINLVGVVYSNTSNNELFDLYVSEKIDSVTFGPPRPYSKKINTKYNEGAACLNKDESMIIFTDNVLRSSTERNLQLYSSKKQNNDWSKPVLLDFCKPEYSYCHPTLSANQKTLYFASDLNGSYGKMDIYYSNYENDTWSQPINLGDKINSSANELFPFISNRKTLYFSSDRSNGYGGLDLYSFNLRDSVNAKSELLEQPLNSKFDDFGISIDSSGLKGYFSSNRNAENRDDIFYFFNKYPNLKNCKKIIKPSFCYTFYEESNTDITEGNKEKELVYEWNLGDGTKTKGLEVTHCYSKPGNYLVELNIVENVSGAVFYNEVSYNLTIVDSQQIYINCPDTISLADTIKISSDKSSIPGHTTQRTFWEFGDHKYANGKEVFHHYQHSGIYIIRLGILAMNNANGIVEEFCVEKQLVVIDKLFNKKE